MMRKDPWEDFEQNEDDNFWPTVLLYLVLGIVAVGGTVFLIFNSSS